MSVTTPWAENYRNNLRLHRPDVLIFVVLLEAADGDGGQINGTDQPVDFLTKGGEGIRWQMRAKEKVLKISFRVVSTNPSKSCSGKKESAPHIYMVKPYLITIPWKEETNLVVPRSLLGSRSKQIKVHQFAYTDDPCYFFLRNESFKTVAPVIRPLHGVPLNLKDRLKTELTVEKESAIISEEEPTESGCLVVFLKRNITETQSTHRPQAFQYGPQKKSLHASRH